MTSVATGGLYAQLLGTRWPELADAVRRLHASAATVCAAGTFRICHGSNRLARFVAWLTGLPAACDAADMRLVVTPTGAGEQWNRSFNGRPLVTTQFSRTGILVEQVGMTELCFQLDVVDGSLHYQSDRAALRMGWLLVPLPSWLAPRVTASEKAGPAGVAVTVEVQLPVLGRLITYQGTLTSIKSQPCLPC
jgi:hypothetical protein